MMSNIHVFCISSDSEMQKGAVPLWHGQVHQQNSEVWREEWLPWWEWWNQMLWVFLCVCKECGDKYFLAFLTLVSYPEAAWPHWISSACGSEDCCLHLVPLLQADEIWWGHAAFGYETSVLTFPAEPFGAGLKLKEVGNRGQKGCLPVFLKKESHACLWLTPGLNPGKGRMWLSWLSVGLANCWCRFDSPVCQTIILPELAFSANSQMVIIQPPCITTCIGISTHSKKFKHWQTGSHTPGGTIKYSTY